MFDLSKFSLKGKTAIVTGGGRGLGRAIAIGYAKAGAKVVLTSRKIADLEATAAEIKAIGGEAFPIAAHLGKMEEIQKTVDTAFEKLGGRIDILVNNAGTSPSMASVLDVQERLWDGVMGLNAKGLYFMSQAAARVMKKQGNGKIINISSIAGFKPDKNVSVYGISKTAVRAITNAFASELAPFNIQVNTIVPGAFDTNMMNSFWVHLSPEEAKKQKAEYEKGLPMGHIGNPDELVGAAIYFASDASSYTTGAELVIDGGNLLAAVEPI
jgi:NAD(P)-dependent dehydrogenase (short-subunit alcohol dehydrogenase family)